MEMWETKAEGSDAVGPKLYQARQGMNLSLTSFRVWILWPNGKDMLPRLLKFLRNYPDYQMDIGWPTPLSTQQCARWGHHFTFCNYQQTFHPSSLSLPILGATPLKDVLLRYISCLSIISYLCPSSLGLPWIPGISLRCQSHYYPCKGLNARVSHGLIQKWTQIAVISSTEQPTGIYSIGARSLRSSPADTPFPLFSLMKNLFSPCFWWSTRWVSELLWASVHNEGMHGSGQPQEKPTVIPALLLLQLDCQAFSLMSLTHHFLLCPYILNGKC